MKLPTVMVLKASLMMVGGMDLVGQCVNLSRSI